MELQTTKEFRKQKKWSFPGQRMSIGCQIVIENNSIKVTLYKPITEFNDKKVQDFERDQTEKEKDVIILSLKLKEIIFKKLNFSDYL